MIQFCYIEISIRAFSYIIRKVYVFPFSYKITVFSKKLYSVVIPVRRINFVIIFLVNVYTVNGVKLARTTSISTPRKFQDPIWIKAMYM